MIVPHENQDVETLREVSYSFDEKGPFYYLQHAGSFGRHTYVDPAPCYTHDGPLVRLLFRHLQWRAPLPIPLKLFILSHEPLDRCNGWYNDEGKWEEVEKDGKTVSERAPVGIIALAGKRIPPHPAMTRYLVPHEYGHAVFYHLARLRGLKSSDDLKKWYIEHVRPETGQAYGCGHWHQNVGEVFANDFRILVARLEHEFWPHEGIPRPEKCFEAVQFWRSVPKELGWEA